MTATVESQAVWSQGIKLRGRVAFVTGGARGIGAAISKSLASQGATVAVGYGRNTEQAQKFLAELSAASDGAEVSVHQGDVGSAGDCQRTIREVIDLHGRLDILINNAGVRSTDDLLDTAGVSGSREAKARFAATFLVDALAPTNTLAGNPAAIRKAFDTGGKSIDNGVKNWVHDLRHNGGWPSQVDSSGFEVGVNMAATPGSVVYRSELIELIQYSPQTPETYAVPLLFCPPWINKFYIMDLAPGKSLIDWAVQHGHTCFAISYRNPDKSMSDLGFRDYLFQGPLDAV